MYVYDVIHKTRSIAIATPPEGDPATAISNMRKKFGGYRMYTTTASRQTHRQTINTQRQKRSSQYYQGWSNQQMSTIYNIFTSCTPGRVAPRRSSPSAGAGEAASSCRRSARDCGATRDDTRESRRRRATATTTVLIRAPVVSSEVERRCRHGD